MEAASISWSIAKQQRRRDRLVGFWAQDEWDIALCPLAQKVSRPVLHRKIDFTCCSPRLNMELKYACWRKLERGEWSPTYGTLPPDVDRALIIDFLSYLSSSGSAEETRKKHLLSLRTFFEVCAREGWSALPEKRLIYEEDLPHPQKALPRFIPQEVLDQLNQQVDTLPPHVMRMVLILQECGMRISELCTMGFECLT